MTKNWMTLAVVAALALGVGCGDDDSTDTTTCDNAADGTCPAGCPSDPDCAGMDMGPPGNPFRPEGLPPASLGEGGFSGPTADTTSPADFASCLGTGTAPAGGDDTTFSLQIREFNTDMAFEGLEVCFFPDNVVSLSGCTGDMVTTDSAGNVSVTAPEGGWYAYRIFENEMGGASMNIVDSFQINEVVPSGDSAGGSSVSQGTLGLIPAVLGLSREPGTALVAGTVQDCAGDPVYGAIVRMYDGGTLLDETEDAETPKYRYFNGDSFPSNSNEWTHVDGLYAAANIPAAASGSTITVEVWGELDGEFQVIGCEEVPTLPDAVSIVNVGPRRADGPTCPGQM